MCTNMAWRPDLAILECTEPGEYCVLLYMTSEYYDVGDLSEFLVGYRSVRYDWA